MACSQCGHDNPSSAKFCNECGALVDRRKAERRQADRRRSAAKAAVPQESTASRRPSLVPSITPGAENAQGHYATTRAGDEADRISGPSFLGLASSGGAGSDYLLEEPQRSHWRAWLVLIILAIIGGLFYMQWRTDWRAQPHETAPPPAMPSNSPPTAPQGKAAPPSDATGVPPTQNAQQPESKPDSSRPPDDSAASARSAHDAKPEPSAKSDDEAAPASDNSPADDNATPAAASSKAHRQPIAKRSTDGPEHADSARDPMLYMAQKYLHGGDAGRNCDQAMIYLRAANQKASAPARSQMGALYSTGTCVPLDRVLAYQWFTSALNLEPNSEDLRRERTNLWAQMSSDERQRAVK